MTPSACIHASIADGVAVNKLGKLFLANATRIIGFTPQLMGHMGQPWKEERTLTPLDSLGLFLILDPNANNSSSISNSGRSGGRSGIPSGATVRDAAPSNVRSPATIAASAVGSKAAESRHGTVTGSGGVGRSGGGVGSNNAVGANLSVSASREGSRVKTTTTTNIRGGTNGTLVMNDPASNNINAQPISSSLSTQSARPLAENEGIRDSLSTSVPKDKRSGSGGRKGAKQSSSSSGSNSSRRRREGDLGGGSEGSAPGGTAGGERRPRKPRSGGGHDRRAGQVSGGM